MLPSVRCQQAPEEVFNVVASFSQLQHLQVRTICWTRTALRMFMLLKLFSLWRAANLKRNVPAAQLAYKCL